MVRYVLPKYSPIKPNANNWTPPKKVITTIKEVQPIGMLESTGLKKTNQIVTTKLNIENRKPSKEDILKGKIEKPVAIWDHKLKSL